MILKYSVCVCAFFICVSFDFARLHVYLVGEVQQITPNIKYNILHMCPMIDRFSRIRLFPIVCSMRGSCSASF